MSLDRNHQDIGYVLGRLFAVLEKTQAEANPGLNATIADRYFGSASSTPIAVFGTLMRLLPHHLNKLEFEGRAVQLQWEIRQILEHCQRFRHRLLPRNPIPVYQRRIEKPIQRSENRIRSKCYDY